MERMANMTTRADFLEMPAFGEATSFTDLELLNLQKGARVGDFTIERFLAAGGMGVLYIATRAGGSEEVALKLLRRGADARAREILRFEQEAAVLARLQHPAIARLIEAGRTADGIPFIAMELVRGESLLDYTKRTAPDIEERLRLFCSICDAVEYAHGQGVVHRDLKPANIYIIDTAWGGAPNIKILDFGLARAVDAPILSATLSHTGEIFGTLAYMSPEQARGDLSKIGPATDIYSLGVILYEWLAGAPPFLVEGRALHEILHSICEDPPGRALRGGLAKIVTMALAKNPADRYISARALADDVRRHLAGGPVLARRPPVLAQLARAARRQKLASAVVILTIASLPAGLGVWQNLTNRATNAEAALVDRNRVEQELRGALEREKSRPRVAQAARILIARDDSVASPLFMGDVFLREESPFLPAIRPTPVPANDLEWIAVTPSAAGAVNVEARVRREDR